MLVQREPYPDNVEAARLILQHRQCGATFSRENCRIIDPERGYAVGGKAPGLHIWDSDDLEGMVREIALWLSTLPSNVEYLGIWTDNGVICVDAVDVISGDGPFGDVLAFGQAKMLGTERRQKAIYDFANRCDIHLED